MGSDVSTAVPTLSSGKYLFPYETLSGRVLTNREQYRSTTGGIARAGPQLARRTR